MKKPKKREILMWQKEKQENKEGAEEHEGKSKGRIRQCKGNERK